MRLIDADALQKAMETIYNDPTCPLHIAANIDQIIDYAPTIDVKMEGGTSVGKWIETVVRGTPSICCSVCGSESPVCYPLNFCPDCGAEMEEE